ncbi:MAG: hypothetical protein AB8I80_06660, partial [Anaerolineae bacterium]
MNPEVARSILRDRKIAYAITNRSLALSEMRDPLGMLGAYGPASIGAALFDIAPELIGSEAELEAILAGKLPRFQLEWVNRVTASGEEIYTILIVLPSYDRENSVDGVPEIGGLIYLVEDVTDIGILQQHL